MKEIKSNAREGEEETPAPATNRRYLGSFAPIVGALVVLTLAAASMNDNNNSDGYGHHRRLHHPREIKEYLQCTRILANSDRNYDNSLDIDEFKDFSNTLADERIGVSIGDNTNLPKQLKAIFVDYAARTEGKSNKIIDIYGSRNGERDGITAHQEELLEDLCNVTSVTLHELLHKEEEHLDKGLEGVGEMHEEDHTEAPATTAPAVVHHAPKKVMVNTSFTMTIPDNMTADDLQHTLDTGEDPGGLKDAFTHFVDDVVHTLNETDVDATDTDTPEGATTAAEEAEGAGRLLLRGKDSTTADEYYPTRRLNIGFDSSSAEIYKFVESLCPGEAPAGEAGDSEDEEDEAPDTKEEKEEQSGSSGIVDKFGRMIGGDEMKAEEEEKKNAKKSNSTATAPPSADDESESESEDEDEDEESLEVFESEEAEEEEEKERGNARKLQLDASNMTETEYVAATTNMSRHALRCVTAMGKFRIEVDEEDEAREGGLEQVYKRAATATKSAIDSGVLEKRLEETPQDNIFHVEGHGVIEDDSFDPYVEVDNKKLRTLDIVLISVGSALILSLCCILCFVELERKTRPRPGV